MSSQSMVTIAAPVALGEVASLRRQIDETLGNPAIEDFCKAVEGGNRRFLHFASLHALAGSDGKAGHLVLEFSADGDETTVIADLAQRAGSFLTPIFARARDWKDGDNLAAYWQAHQVKIGFDLFDTPGLAFCGTPGQSVDAILEEDQLSRQVASWLARINAAEPPLRRLAEVRRHLAGSKFAWALEPAAPPLAAPAKELGVFAKVLKLAPSFVLTFLWPLLVLLPLCVWLAWPESWAWNDWPEDRHLGWDEGLGALKQVAGFLAATEALFAAFVALVLGLAFLAFTRQEKGDFLSERSPTAEEAREMVKRENDPDHVQNHMMSHTVLKPGLLRMLTIRLAFWAIAKLTALNPRVGHLGDIGTIHFARWVMMPGTRDVIFCSNYGGSWESYLEDFITKAHGGLTAVWSNTVGFPRSRNLFQEGASDGERFKRYARQSMIHTPFWYCAYPALTTANIRGNQLIRRGIAAAMTESEAVEWLALFGSAPRPLEKLETTQIQSLVFGGMGFKPEGRLLVIDLGDNVAKNRAWLSEILPQIAFNDGRYDQRAAVLTLAATARGLAKLGLDADTLDTFPAAFTQGMHGAGRERILGDLGANASATWDWGYDGNDIALLVYGDRPADVRKMAATMGKVIAAAGGQIRFSQDLTHVSKNLSDRKEPFGFVDGVSQPAIRGTYRGLRNDDPIHLVEPGEFVLGYPDNRGNVPPGPTMEARHDPDLRLPVAGAAHGFAETVAENPRLAGYNGSFLVIRQLEQNWTAFEGYCRKEAANLAGAFPDLPLLTDPDDMTAYVGAKMIGRWQDGSSLVRYPYISASRLKAITGQDPNAKTARPKSHPTDPQASPVAPSDARADTAAAGAKTPAYIRPDNDFLYGTEDPQGLRCPFGAHIRRANPRESLSPGSNDQIDISNRHRIIRVGRGYLAKDGKTTAGLMFMCLNGDIERQFEFIQQTWMGSTKFHGLTAEADPIAGRGLAGGDGFTIPTRRGPVGLSPLPQFVTVKGGGYFFLPGRQLLAFLAGP